MDQSPLTLYGAGTSRTLRPIWVAEELGLPYRLEPIGPRTGETRTEAYTRLNPKQKIPTLVHGDFVLSESVAIIRYLRDISSSATLYRPVSPYQRAREDEWCCYVYGELDETSLYVMRRHRDLASIYGEAPAAVDSSAAYAERHLAVIDQALDGRDSVMEGGFGIADVLLQSCLDWAIAYDVTVPPGLLAYRERMAKRPAYQAAVAVNYHGGG